MAFSHFHGTSVNNSGLVGWNGEKIVRAINGEDMEWEKPDGTPRDSNPMDLPRFTC